VTFRVGSRSGKRSKTVRVYTNDPQNKFVKLTVSADVKVVLAAKPNRVYFGTFKKGETPIKYIRLTGLDSEQTRITRVETAARKKILKTEISSESPVVLAAPRVMVSVLPDVAVGRLRERITLYTDHEKIKKITVYAYGEVKGDIKVRPKYLSLGNLQRDKPVEKTITLEAAENTSFKVLKVSSSDPEVDAVVETVRDGRSYRVTVSPRKDFSKNMLRGNILIETDNKEQNEIKVNFFGRVRNVRPKRKSETVNQ